MPAGFVGSFSGAMNFASGLGIGPSILKVPSSLSSNLSRSSNSADEESARQNSEDSSDKLKPIKCKCVKPYCTFESLVIQTETWIYEEKEQ